jgi:hypothetical protein
MFLRIAKYGLLPFKSYQVQPGIDGLGVQRKGNTREGGNILSHLSSHNLIFVR